MSEKQIPDSFYMKQLIPKKQKKYKKDLDRPECVNINCTGKVHNMGYDDNGKPHYRSVCGRCHYANIGYKNFKYKQGVIPIKKDYCENYLDKRLGIKCPTKHDKTKINMAQETGVLPSRDLHLDHIDGDHYHNVAENVQTLCSACHTYKTKKYGDLKSRGPNRYIRNGKVVKQDMRRPDPKPIKHTFF